MDAELYYDYHVSVIRHGRRVCKAPLPVCDRCILADGCPSAFFAEQGARDGQEYLLTIAAPAGVAKIDSIEVEEIHQYLDFINVMTYDFAGSWSPATNFNAPLYRQSSPLRPQDELSLNANAHAAMQVFLRRGVPPDKLVLGVPFYGRGWKGVADVNDGLYQPNEGGVRLRTNWRSLAHEHPCGGG